MVVCCGSNDSRGVHQQQLFLRSTFNELGLCSDCLLICIELENKDGVAKGKYTKSQKKERKEKKERMGIKLDISSGSESAHVELANTALSHVVREHNVVSGFTERHQGWLRSHGDVGEGTA